MGKDLYTILIPKPLWFQKSNFQNYKGSCMWSSNYTEQLIEQNFPQLPCYVAGGLHTATSMILKIISLISGLLKEQNGVV